MAPTTKATGSSFGTKSRTSDTVSTWKDVPIFLHPVGKWSVIGFFITWKIIIFDEGLWDTDVTGGEKLITQPLTSLLRNPETEEFSLHFLKAVKIWNISHFHYIYSKTWPRSQYIYICPVFSLINMLEARVHSWERGCPATLLHGVNFGKRMNIPADWTGYCCPLFVSK